MQFINRLSRSFSTSAFFIFRKSSRSRVFILLGVFYVSCGVSKKVQDENIHLTYLDDLIIENTADSIRFGGISGIDYQNDILFMISDSGNHPRIFTSELQIDQQKLKLSSPKLFLDIKTPKDQYFDLESIQKISNSNSFLISSEGNIKKGIAPGIFKLHKNGKVLNNYELPDNYQIKNKRSEVIHNRAIEAVTFNKDKTGFWFSTEFPLRSEGKPPKLLKSGAAQKFLFYNLEKHQITSWFKYQLDPIPKLPLLPYSLNGLTGMQLINSQKIITIERGFSAGWGKHSNRVKLFLIQSDEALNKVDQQSIRKYLLLDLKKIKKQLKADRIDNIEGICLGPELADGSATLLLISDDNFDTYNDQITQLIWLKINL